MARKIFILFGFLLISCGYGEKDLRDYVAESLDCSKSDDCVEPPLIAVDPIWTPESQKHSKNSDELVIEEREEEVTNQDADNEISDDNENETCDDCVDPPMIAIDPIWSENVKQISDEWAAAERSLNEHTGKEDDACDDCVDPPLIAIDPIWTPGSRRYPDEWDDIDDSVNGNNREEEVCTIGTNNGDLPMNQPLLVSPTTKELLQPSPDGFVKVENGATIDMYCTGSFSAPLTGKKITATCAYANGFEVNGNLMNMTEINCSGMAANLVRKTNRTCYDGAVIVEIGFDIVDAFIPFMEICFNVEKHFTLYNHYAMGPYNSAYQRSIPRPMFISGGLYNGIDVNTFYTQIRQKETVDSILGYDSQRYFDLSRDVYMARGHMAAKVDFVYAPGQWATFYYINTAPQWQTFNGGNWERVESGVRNFAADRNLDLDVYTGTWGVMSLPDLDGLKQELYLNFDKNGNGLLRVPKIYYRVIIDKVSKLGVVLIGVNNIHATLEEITEEYILCEDVSDLINWISWDKRNILRGYSYACDVNEFAERIGELPPLEVSGLLY